MAAACFLLAGCQIANQAKDTWTQGGEMLQFLVANQGQSAVERDEVLAIPFATLGVRLGRAPQSILALNQTAGSAHLWAAADGLTLVTENGRLVRTAGLADNLTGARFEGADPLALPLRPGASDGTTYIRHLDFGQSRGFQNRAECRVQVTGHEDLTIIGVAIPTDVWTEKCRVKSLKWRFSNTYWRDSRTGYVWRSRQWISPELGYPVDLEVLRPSGVDPNWQIHTALISAMPAAQ